MANATTMDPSAGTAITLTELWPIAVRHIQLKRPFYVWGSMGLGKTSLISAMAKFLGYKFVDIRMSQMGSQDIIGIPIPNRETGTVVWSRPDFIPTEEDAKKYPGIILFFDEINLASPSIIASCYQIINERRVGQFALPDNVVCIAAGNGAKDSAFVQKLAKPLSNRFSHYYIKVDFQSWMSWATTRAKPINPKILAYLNQNPSKLHDFDPSSGFDAFATPRTWEFLSDLITEDEFSGPISDDLIRKLACGTVGPGTGNDFMSFLAHGMFLPRPKHILEGHIKDLVGTDGKKITSISAHYQLVVGCIVALHDKWQTSSVSTGKKLNTHQNREFIERKWNSRDERNTWMKQFQTLIAYLMRHFGKELNVMALRMMFTNYQLNLADSETITTPEFKQFTAEYTKYFTSELK